MNEELFEKVKKKTHVDKETIVELAKKVSDNGLKDETTLRDVIHQLSGMTGKEVTSEMEDKIIGAILEDKVPKSIDNMF